MKAKIARDRLVLGSYHYLRYPLDYFLDTAAELGVSQVELWAAAPHLCLYTAQQEDIRQTARMIRDRGLRVCCITPEQCTYPVNLAAEEKALRQYSIDMFQRAIDVAVILESEFVLVTAGCGYFNHSVEEAWNRSADSLDRLARYAWAAGITLALETLTPISSNLLNTPEQQRKMLRLLPPDSTVPMLDIGQMAYMGHDLSRYLDKTWPLGHVHLQDSGQAIHMALGDGQLPLEDCLDQLENWGYRGRYAFEFNDPRYRADPAQADRQSLKWLEDRNLLSD